MKARAAYLFGVIGAVAFSCAPVPEADITVESIHLGKTEGTTAKSIQTDDRECRIVEAIDGDTIKIACPDGSTGNARLMGFDTPETFRAGCVEEKRLGERATRHLEARIRASESLGATGHGRDKYQRRLMRLYINGEDIAKDMITNGYAVPYSGGKRIDWCKKLKS